MKTSIASAAASALILGLSLASFAAQPPPAKLVEGKDRPILLKRMVVIATPLP
ncbi:MAG TPA: hypothetical protein VJM09_12685 [Sphingobium sp.]|nr:hypothetical protein [Sphingobium sp.]